MKITAVLFIYILLLAGFGCKKVDKLTQFNLSYNTPITVPKSSGIKLPFDVFSPDMETKSEGEFKNNNTRKDLVEKILLKKLDLTIKSPKDKTFKFLKSIEVYIAAEGLSDLRLGYRENISDDIGAFLSLDINDNDFKEYIKKDKFSIKTKVVTDEFLSSDYEIDVYSEFFVDAKIAGV